MQQVEVNNGEAIELNPISDEARQNKSAQQSIQNDDSEAYPESSKLFFILSSLCLAVFLVSLDEGIITTAIPKITDQFQSLSDAGWYASCYLITMSTSQLLFGKVFSYFPLKTSYVVSIAIFELGSLICGVAPSSSALIIGRAIAGIGGAGIMTGAFVIIAVSIPLHKRAVYLGLIEAVFAIGSVAGPLLGGVFTDSKLTWRWCFFINLPFGVIAAAITLYAIKTKASTPPSQQKSIMQKINKLDLPGQFLLLLALFCILYSLQMGGVVWPWNSVKIIILLVLGGVFSLAYIAFEIWKGNDAGLPPRIIGQRSIAFGAIFMAFLAGCLFTLMYYIPIWLQAIKGVSAVRSGILNLPFLLGVMATSLTSGALTSFVGYYNPFMIASGLFMGLGAGLLFSITPDAKEGMLIGYQLLAGLGVGLGIQQSNMAAMRVLSPEDIPVGAGIMQFALTLGGGLTVAIAQTVFQNTLISLIQARVPEIPDAANFVVNIGATELKAQVEKLGGPALVVEVLLAYNSAILKTFLLATVMGAVAILPALSMPWMSMKRRNMAASNT
ncbi:MFS general substrate transporter [Microthyrium microscopicum]|uniref:MFS general substrate transporter n=1 Tax=Microthyrium microscopicum TaxID=703497 RepID=A0A6A6ULW0_9PEZI|nr:MFS general substrate transporter [Microthyrium microscopicum]